MISTNSKIHTLVTLKGFGDFVIALNAINSVKAVPEFQLVAGKHVMALADDLGMTDQVIFIGGEDLKDVPAIYDIKKRGWFSGLKSLQQLHSLIGNFPHSSTLIFDKVGIRERIIGAGHELYQLPESSNIYLAYTQFFKEMGYERIAQKPRERDKNNQAIIVPGARVGKRVIPPGTIKQISQRLLNYDFEVKVIMIEGESYEIPHNVNLEIIPRKFSSLIDAINSADLVISADSLPAHLSEFLGAPVFIFTPIPNWSIYWLPKSAFNSKGMATFEDISNFDRWLYLHC
jgi:ADP-heptose:LPS heptosyltransferase